MLFYANDFHTFLPGEMFLNPSAYPFAVFDERESKLGDENTFQTTISSSALWLNGNVIPKKGRQVAVAANFEVSMPLS